MTSAQRRKLPGVFCLEGDWDSDLYDRSSVRPLLELLEAAGEVPYVHRRVATSAEVQLRLDWWLGPGKNLNVAYLASHGSRLNLWFGGEGFSLDDLAAGLGTRAAGKVIYLGGCSILGGREEPLIEFCQRTGVKALVGYTRQVDWIAGASFELVLLRELVRSRQVPTLHRRMLKDFPTITSSAGFRIATGDRVFSA
jgi:hypothetical protein